MKGIFHQSCEVASDLNVERPVQVFGFALLLGIATGGLPGASQARHDDEGPSRLVMAAPVKGGAEWSPRRLFNAGLEAEERGNLVHATQLYMAARLATRTVFADDLYARGSGLRLLRVLAGRDSDAAVAAAILVAGSARASDLAPLVRSLVRRLHNEPRLEALSGTILSMRYHRRTGRVLVELEDEMSKVVRIVDAEGPVGPFSAGHRVRAVVRRMYGDAEAGWRVVALAAGDADGWQLLRVRGLPGEPVRGSGALLASVAR